MYHMAAYTQLLGNTANTDIAALTDSVLTISNGHFRLVDNMSLVAASAQSPTLLEARLDSPTIRIPGNPFILPPLVSLLAGTEPRVMDLTQMPFPLPQREEIAMQASSGIACGTERFTGFIWLSLGYTPPPPGRVYWVKLTSTTAAVANVWTPLTTTFASSLPTGYWSCIGIRGVATHGFAYRMIFPGQVYRPGALAVVANTGRQAPLFIDGSLGEMGRFVNDNVPIIETLNNSTDNAHTIYLALVQVGSL